MTKFNKILLSSLIAILIAFGMTFTVYQTDRAIILRFNRIKTDKNNESIVYQPGFNIKVPLIDNVLKFDTRYRVLDITASRITTIEKKDVLVDYYVLWQIDDIPLFYRRTQGVKSRAEILLEQKANAVLKIEFGRLTIKEVVSSARSALMDNLRKNTFDVADELGIKVLDVRVKRIDLPKEVSDSVYTRMRAERERKANTFRAEGEKESISIRANADKKRAVIMAGASKDANKIMGQGDAAALNIYANAYSKAPQFYEFYRSLEAYKGSFKDKNDIFVLKPDSEFFKYFNNTGN